MSKHTPGPWKADVEGPFTLGGDTISVEAVTGDGKLVRREICTLLIDTEENDDTPEALEDKANALLIAAAPDLLVACDTALAHLHWANTHGDRCDETIAAVQAAIIKATS